MIGGCSWEGEAIDSVQMYSIDRDSWSDTYPLNEARADANACLLERETSKMIYVFCGTSDNGVPLNSIEALDVQAWTAAAAADRDDTWETVISPWQLIVL